MKPIFNFMLRNASIIFKTSSIILLIIWLLNNSGHIIDKIFNLVEIVFHKTVSFDVKDLILYMVIFLLFVSALKVGLSRISMYLKHQSLKPKNTYTKGEQRIANKRDMKKAFVISDVNEIYTFGLLVKRVKVINFGLFEKEMPFFEEEVDKFEFSKDQIKALEEKDQKRNFVYKFIDSYAHDRVYLDINPIHQLIIGTTRSGKSQTYVMPQIKLFANMKNKSQQPNLIVTDPKGELFTNTSKLLEHGGYKVVCLNVKDTEFSSNYNLLENTYNKYMKVMEDNYINNDFPADNEELGKGLSTEDKIVVSKINQRIKNNGGIEYDFTDTQREVEILASIIIDNTGEKDPYWQKSASDLLKTLIFYTLEYNYYLNKDKITFSNIMFNISEYYMMDGDEYKFQSIVRSLNTRHSSVAYDPGGVEKTFSNMLSVLKSSLSIFNSRGIQNLTDSNDINFNEINEGFIPTAIFIITPDYDDVYNKFITVFVNQLYGEACKYSDKNKSGGKLSRKLLFIIDEFANIPKIENISNKLTVSLGRNISFVLIIQNFAQLEETYGDKTTKTMLDNIHNKVYLLAGTEETRSDFCKMIGSTTIMKGQISGNDIKTSNISWSEEEKKLVHQEELEKMKLGTSYMVSLKNFPSKNYLKPFFMDNDIEQQTAEEFIEKTNRIYKLEN